MLLCRSFLKGSICTSRRLPQENMEKEQILKWLFQTCTMAKKPVFHFIITCMGLQFKLLRSTVEGKKYSTYQETRKTSGKWCKGICIWIVRWVEKAWNIQLLLPCCSIDWWQQIYAEACASEDIIELGELWTAEKQIERRCDQWGQWQPNHKNKNYVKNEILCVFVFERLYDIAVFPGENNLATSAYVYMQLVFRRQSLISALF